jgi:hypothetical protein
LTEDFIYDLAGKLIFSMNRFFPSQIFINMLFFSGSAAILNKYEQNDIFIRASLTFFLGFLFCVFGKLIHEKFEKTFLKFKINQKNLKIILLICGLVPFFFIYNFRSIYFKVKYVGFVLSIISAIFYISSLYNFSECFTYLFLRITLIGIISFLIMIASCTTLYIFNLIKNFSNFAPYKINLLFWFTVIFLTFGTIAIPVNGSKPKESDFFWKAILKFLLPIYFILFFIFTLYGIKIVFIQGTEFFENFEILLSVLFSIYIFLTFILMQYENDKKSVKIFLNLGGYLNFILIFIQFFALNQTITRYGMNSMKYIMIVESETMIITSLSAIFKKRKYVKHIPLLFSFAILFITITPFNILDVPIREQNLRLVKILSENNMFEEKKIVPNSNISQRNKEKISLYYKNIIHMGGKKLGILPIDNKDFENVFGFKFIEKYEIPKNIKKLDVKETYRYDF